MASSVGGGNGSGSSSRTGFLEPILDGRLPCSALIWGGTCLVLFQIGMSGLVGSPRKALPILSSEWGFGIGEVVRGQEKGREGELCMVCKMKTKFLIKELKSYIAS